MKFASLLFCLLLTPVTSVLHADLIDILVPAYANPCCDGGPNMWSSLIATAGDSNRNFQLHAIFNPASGPGTMRDANFLDGADNGPLNDFRVAGGITHGYVPTDFGNRSAVDVKADVDKYLTGFYGGFVDGIFFDEMSNDLADVGYYQDLRNYVQANQAGARTFGNPGTTSTNNPSGQSTFSATDYMASLNTIITFENTGAEYATNYTSFPYVENLDRLNIGHILHTQANWDASILNSASARGAGFLYVTDDVLVNPFDTLTSYWPQFTADVSAFNVPEPGSLLFLGIGAVAISLNRTRRQTKHETVSAGKTD